MEADERCRRIVVRALTDYLASVRSTSRSLMVCTCVVCISFCCAKVSESTRRATMRSLRRDGASAPKERACNETTTFDESRDSNRRRGGMGGAREAATATVEEAADTSEEERPAAAAKLDEAPALPTACVCFGRTRRGTMELGAACALALIRIASSRASSRASSASPIARARLRSAMALARRVR